MKNTLSAFSAIALIILVTGVFVGCSKDSAAKKVNVSEKINALKSQDNNARVDALVALATAGEKAAPAVPALIETLKDKDPDVRRLAAYALGEIGPKASPALPALKELMQRETVREVQTQLVNTLRNIDQNAKDLKAVNVSGQP